MEQPAAGKANRLIDQKSPYLQQHAYNPVSWYPWGEEAFARAKAEDKPVFLSIGYSTCHWCHVMEKESFEDREVAELLNSYFIAIKVDREERPDLDQVYMAACQALTGQGGWPLTVFMTADKKPFFAATYLPKYPRYGVNGLMNLLPKLHRVWLEERDKVEKAADELTALLHTQADEGQAGAEGHGASILPGPELLENAYRQFEKTYDREHGGFGGAPKFPTPHQLSFLLRYWRRSGEGRALEMVLETLKAMHRGGIFDQLGHGMHRYAVDERWLVPHFEKMLYDQATTALAALEAYQASKDPEIADFAKKIFSYVLGELTSPEGAFYAAEDADSEGAEGTFYVWRPQEILELLGEEVGRLVNAYYAVTAEGNFEGGASVLNRPVDDLTFAGQQDLDPDRSKEILEKARLKMLAARARRSRPFRDDKILTAWNGLMIAALARGAALFGETRYAEAAGRAADFILAKMTGPQGRLLRRYRDGEAAVSAFLEDYAFLVRGLLELYRATFDSRRLEQARTLTMEMVRLFSSGDGTLLFSADPDQCSILPVKAEAYDGAHPSGVSVAAMNLVQIGRLLHDEDLVAKGELILASYKDKFMRYPTGHTYLLMVLDYVLSPPEELTISGQAGSEAVEALSFEAHSRFRPNLDLLFRPAGDHCGDDAIFGICPFIRELEAPADQAAAYYCLKMSCRPAVTTPQQLAKLLDDN